MSTTATVPQPRSRGAQALLLAAPDPVLLSMPTTEEIAAYAYGLFEARSYEHGHDVEDWLEAEHALLAERAARLGEVAES